MREAARSQEMHGVTMRFAELQEGGPCTDYPALLHPLRAMRRHPGERVGFMLEGLYCTDTKARGLLAARTIFARELYGTLWHVSAMACKASRVGTHASQWHGLYRCGYLSTAADARCLSRWPVLPRTGLLLQGQHEPGLPCFLFLGRRRGELPATTSNSRPLVTQRPRLLATSWWTTVTRTLG